MKKLYLNIVLSLIFINVNAQTKSTFLNKTNQHSFSAEYAAVSYSYAHRFKTNVIFGIRTQIGLGLAKMLASTPTYVDFGYGNGSEKVTPNAASFEVLKLQIFYRYAISNSFYFDVGPVASLTLFGESEWEKKYCVGIEASAYYTFWRMHVGIRLKGAMSFNTQNTEGINSKNTYYALYATPLVIGFNF